MVSKAFTEAKGQANLLTSLQHVELGLYEALVLAVIGLVYSLKNLHNVQPIARSYHGESNLASRFAGRLTICCTRRSMVAIRRC